MAPFLSPGLSASSSAWLLTGLVPGRRVPQIIGQLATLLLEPSGPERIERLAVAVGPRILARPHFFDERQEPLVQTDDMVPEALERHPVVGRFGKQRAGQPLPVRHHLLKAIAEVRVSPGI